MEAGGGEDYGSWLVIRTPSGYPQQVPYISIAQQYLRLMNQFAEQLA
jgi:hypothetical protein